jgi:hypothetical protein
MSRHHTHINHQTGFLLFINLLIFSFLLSDLSPHFPDRQHVVCLRQTVQADDDRDAWFRLRLVRRRRDRFGNFDSSVYCLFIEIRQSQIGSG